VFALKSTELPFHVAQMWHKRGEEVIRIEIPIFEITERALPFHTLTGLCPRCYSFFIQQEQVVLLRTHIAELHKDSQLGPSHIEKGPEDTPLFAQFIL
jgi:hypothetical protein